MIKLKTLLLESGNIIVGLITADDDVISHKDAVDHCDVVYKTRATYNKRIKNKWRYNKRNKVVYWWEDWSKNDGELVMDHLRHKYGLEVVQQLLIGGDDYNQRYNKAHDLQERRK